MFSINDTIIYGNYGICTIIGKQNMTVDSVTGSYYVLKPVFEDSSTLYLPVGNEKTEEKMRRILSAEEIYAIIKEIPDEETIWIDNEKERKERYKDILFGNDRSALVRLIKTLYLHSEELKDDGKKMHASDERFLKDAEKALYDEFAHVLGIEPEEVLPFIRDRIEKNSEE